MTTTMTPNHAAPGSWDVRCEPHGLDVRGLSLDHAIAAKDDHDTHHHPGASIHDAYAQALIAQGVEYAEAADQAWVQRRANVPGAITSGIQAEAGQQATAEALALYLGTSPDLATILILKAVQ